MRIAAMVLGRDAEILDMRVSRHSDQTH